MSPELAPAGEERFRELFQNSYDMQYTYELGGRITGANRALEKASGYPIVELLEMNVSELFGPAGTAAGARAEETEPISGMRELELLTKEGARIPIEVATRPIAGNGRQSGMHSIAREIRERKQVEEQLLRLASHDPLTGLFTRRRFEEELQVQLAQARRLRVHGALLVLDLDHFKDVNDSLGHRVGDEVLSHVAQLFQERFPEGAILGRVGGDEYGVITPQLNADNAEALARQVLVCLQNQEVGSDHPIRVTASIGIAQIPSDGFVTAQELLSQADLAMYEAKEKGRNRVVVHSAGIDWQARLEADLAWRRKISEALERGQFVLHAQPVLSVAEDRIASYELLIRLQDAEGQVVSASEFISRAERFGLIRSIDEWVVGQAVELLEKRSSGGSGLRIAVNISASSLADSELLDRMRSKFGSSSAQPSDLVLEVTESACVENLPEAQRFVREAKRLGCQVALDDFGVGSSSFAHLKLLGVNYLKIDGSFIRNIAHDATDQELVKAIVAIGRALGKKTVAEYVIDEQTFAVVKALGVDYAQGEYIGETLDARQVLNGARPAA